MKSLVLLGLLSLGTLASNLSVANEISPNFLKKEIASAQTQYLSGSSDSGLYALQALARLLESDKSTSLHCELGPNNLSFTYLRIGLLHERAGNNPKAKANFEKALNTYKGEHIQLAQLKDNVLQLDEMHN